MAARSASAPAERDAQGLGLSERNGLATPALLASELCRLKGAGDPVEELGRGARVVALGAQELGEQRPREGLCVGALTLGQAIQVGSVVVFDFYRQPTAHQPQE